MGYEHPIGDLELPKRVVWLSKIRSGMLILSDSSIGTAAPLPSAAANLVSAAPNLVSAQITQLALRRPVSNQQGHMYIHWKVGYKTNILRGHC